SYAGAIFDSYSHGNPLSDVGGVVASAITSGKLPLDDNGVYFVFTSADVDQPGFCTNYCGWHTWESVNDTQIKYLFVGDARRCNGSCGGLGTTPNGDATADDMASIASHELEETATDPLIDAWGDANGENADKCAWNFGAEYTTPNGAQAN